MKITNCSHRTRVEIGVPFGNHSLHCGNPDCEHNGKEVNYFICEACPHRKEGEQKVVFPVPMPAKIPDSVPRPDLKAIETTLPVEDPVKVAERTFKPPIFHDDGSIEYIKAEGDWEPPRDINGYARDPNNKWLFHPLWPVCGLRYQMAFLKANCGCIDVIMRCNNPQSPEFGARLAHETCAKCPVRVK